MLCFIIVFKWGMWGAAIATGIAQMGSFAFLCTHFYNGNSTIMFERKPRFSPVIIWKIIVNGFPSFIIEFAIAVVILLLDLFYENDRRNGSCSFLNCCLCVLYFQNDLQRTFVSRNTAYCKFQLYGAKKRTD